MLTRSRKLSAFFFLAWTAFACSVQAAEKMPEPPFEGMPLGERLVYKITWLGIPVGNGEVWVKEKIKLNGRDVFHVVGTVVTNKVLRTIFPVHDEAHSWIDAETFESVQFEKDVNELIVKAHERLTFDRGKKKGRLESFKTGKKSDFDVTLPIHDVLSGFFWVRRNLRDPKETLHITITADQMDWNMTVPGFKRKTIEIHGKKADTLWVEPVTRVKGKETWGKGWFNLSTDSSRKPLRVKYKAPFGSVTGTLRDEKETGQEKSLSHED